MHFQHEPNMALPEGEYWDNSIGKKDVVSSFCFFQFFKCFFYFIYVDFLLHSMTNYEDVVS